ncbi:MAG TPA: hypothetical protein ENH06_01315 [bacterium]|nr:hypothetical protein [bacterium]
MFKNIFYEYLEWHFLDVPKFIIKIWKNFLLFNLNYWSIFLLFKTLFSPWRRYKFSYGKMIDLNRYFEAFTFNAISRGIGVIMRSVLILVGLLMEIFILFSGLIIFSIWIILPVFIIAGFLFGFKIIYGI